MINIQNPEDILNKLEHLNPDAKPVWGKMSPQHIVEHLALALQISTGKSPQILYLPEEEAARVKGKIIHTEGELPMGIKTPILGDEPPPLVYPDLSSAINHLQDELKYWNEYSAKNPQAIHMHPRMGPLNQKEWTILHGKHFTHHLKQFGLV